MAELSSEIDSRGQITITVRGELVSGDTVRFKSLADQLTKEQARERWSDSRLQ